jgi:hypothetical protein
MSPLSLGYGYLDKKKEKDKKEEADDEEINKDKLRKNGGRTKIAYKCQFACQAPSLILLRPESLFLGVKQSSPLLKNVNDKRLSCGLYIR